MAQTLKLKRSAVSGNVPTTSNLALGEIAINTYDGNIFIKKNDGSDSIVTFEPGGTGNAGTIEENNFTGNGSTTAFTLSSAPSSEENLLVFIDSAFQNRDAFTISGTTLTFDDAPDNATSVRIYHVIPGSVDDGILTVAKFAGSAIVTEAEGIASNDNDTTLPTSAAVKDYVDSQVATADTLSEIIASGNTTGGTDIAFADNDKALFGAGSDLQIYHNSTDSVIDNITGDLYITNKTDDGDIIFRTDDGSGGFTSYIQADGSTGEVRLYHYGSEKLNTYSEGVIVDGRVITDSLISSGITNFGNIIVTGTVDGVDIAARDAILTSTTTTANAALPRAGGALTGAVTTNSTFDGRDVATDGTKLDTIETSATADQTQAEINALGITATGLSGTPNVSIGNITTTGYLRGPSTFTIDPATHGDDTGTLVIAGNLQVDGTTTTINSTTLTVDDKLVTLASGSANAGAANGAGIEVDISGATNPSLTYDGTNDEWDFNKDINVTGSIRIDNGASFTAYEVYRDNILYGRVGGGSNQFTIQASNNKNINLFDDSGVGLTVKDGGNVGIGIDTPTEKLHVIGNLKLEQTSNVDSYIRLNPNSASLGATYRWDIIANNSASNYDLHINKGTDTYLAITNSVGQEGGNVGIGTSSPTEKLHIAFADTDTAYSGGNSGAWGSAGLKLENSTASANTRAHIHFRNNDADIHIAGIRQATNDSDLGFFFEGSEKVRFTNGGNVGIGTTSPQGKLDVDGDLRITRNIVSNTVYEMLSLGSDRTTDDYGGLNKDYWRLNLVTPGSSTDGGSSAHAYGTLVFSGVTGTNTTYSDRMAITAGGNVGIGTNTPLHKLAIGGNSTATLKSTVAITDMTNGASLALRGQAPTIFFDSTSAGIPTILMDGRGIEFKDGTLDSQGNVDVKIDAAGNVGIGTTTPDTKLDITTSGVEGLILNQDTTTAATSSRLFFKDSTRINGMLNVSGILEFRTDMGVGSTSGTKRFSISPTLVKSEVPLRVEEYQIDTTVTSTTATTQVAIHSFVGSNCL